MLNVETKVDEKKKTLTITVDLTQRHELSNSGNTITVASTQGAAKLGVGDLALNLSIYTKEGLAKAQQVRAKEQGYTTWAEYQAALKGAK